MGNLSQIMLHQLHYHIYNPDRVQSGKTYKQINNILEHIKTKRDIKEKSTYVFVANTHRSCDVFRNVIVDILKAGDYRVSANGSTIRVGGTKNIEGLISILVLTVQELPTRTAGVHPSPYIFLDHTVEEDIVRRSLENAEARIREMSLRSE